MGGVRMACRLVDMTPEELTTTEYSSICRKLCDSLNSSNGQNVVTMTEIVGDELRNRGYGGLYGVGKAANCPPRLVQLVYEPTAPTTATTKTVALVGKGIVYDTGGLALKTKTGMPGMKSDMGGSAGLLGAFTAAVRLRVPTRIILVLCLAENAIGPDAFRNDDVLKMYSGKTVEVNNSDAEGRLVLGDGVAHVTRRKRRRFNTSKEEGEQQQKEELSLVVDMATLTGAQLITTGKRHASVLCNTMEWEQRVIKAGKLSGDLCFPILYAPDLLMDEFRSTVADMKNSVADRSNAQTSCAGHFIESHLDPTYTGGWIHVDMAGPAFGESRGTGYGVNLVLALLDSPGFVEKP